VVADWWGLTAAISVVAVLTAASGEFVAIRMYETLDRRPGSSLPPLRRELNHDTA